MDAPTTDAYPYVAVGERMTLTLASGMTLVGLVVDLHHAPDGQLVCVRVHPDADDQPVAVNAAMIMLWRRGEPVRQVPQRLMVPAAIPNGGQGLLPPGG